MSTSVIKVICIATPKQIKDNCSSGFVEQFGIYEAEDRRYYVSPGRLVSSTEYRIKLDHLPTHKGYTIDLPKKFFMSYNEWLAKERERQIKEIFD